MGASRGLRRRLFVPFMLVMLMLLGACAGTDEPEATETTGQTTTDADTEAQGDDTETEETQELVSANIGVPGKSSAFIHTYVAEGAGIFEQCGLDATIVEMQAPQVAAALESGDIDVAANTGSNIRAAFQGLPVRVVAVTKNNFDYAILANGITSPEELAGKSIVSAAPTSTPGVALRAALEDLGLTDEVEIVSASDTAARVTLLQAGEVDASLINTDGALRLQAENPDLNIVYRPEDFPPNPYTGVVTTMSTIEGNRELVEKTISAYLEAGRFIVENPEDTQAIYEQAFDLTSEQAAEMYELTTPLIVEDGMPTDELLQGEARLNTITLERDVTVEEVQEAIDLSILESLESTC